MDKINEIWPEWQVEELLGTGSFGKVYKVRREKMGYTSYAAVKIIELPQEMTEIKNLKTSGMDNSSIHVYYKDMIKDLMNEIKVMESLKTANNVVAIEDYEVVEKKDEFGWIILIRMELLHNLGEYLEIHPMMQNDVVRLGVDICNALSNCEKENIIHRDIKIDNIFINTFGTYKLGDFGISKQLEKTSSVMSQKGTNMYMAPEIYRGEVYGSTVDIYSLGIMLYRILNGGRFPFMPPASQPLRYDDMKKAMQRRLSGEPVPEIAGINKKLFGIVKKACAFNAEGRFASAAEMGRELSMVWGELEADTENERTYDAREEEIYQDIYAVNRTMAAFGQNASSLESEGMQEQIELNEDDQYSQLILNAYEAIQKEKYKKAIAYCDEAICLGISGGLSKKEAYYVKGLALFAKGNLKKALAVLQAGQAELYDEKIEIEYRELINEIKHLRLILKAYEAIQNEEFDQAIAYCDEAGSLEISEESSRKQEYYGKGLALFGKGDLEQALAVLQAGQAELYDEAIEKEYRKLIKKIKRMKKIEDWF